MEENERKKHSFFKSPLIREPSTKIKWPDLITETQSLMRASWPEIAEDYISTYCTDVEITNPFTKEKVSLIGSPKENQTKPETYTETSPEEYGEWLNG
jgi:hypothetical protein